MSDIRKAFKKALIVLLTGALLFGMVPELGIEQVYAADAPPALQPSGNGTETSPYLIASTENLVWMATNNNANNGFDGKYFMQTAYININNGGSWFLWTPIGNPDMPFKGVYNGNGKTVSGLTIRANGPSRQGLFGVSSGELRNIGITSCDMEGLNSSEVGALAGRNSGTISGCFTSGRINYSKSARVGGLVGINSGSIENSYSSCDVHIYTAAEIGYSDIESTDAGGLVGTSSGVISNSFATGIITGYKNVGGLVGYSANGQIFSSYFSGTATPIAPGYSSNSFIGVMANAEVRFCRGIAGAGDLLDGTTSVIVDYYQNQPASSFKTLTTYTDNENWHTLYPWDMTSVWETAEGSYPALRNTRALNTAIYDGNGNTGGTAPTDSGSYEQGATVTVLGNAGILTKTGDSFAGWNTQADGNGTDRGEGSTFTMGIADVTLYAKWTDSTAPSLTAGTINRSSDTAGTVKFTSDEAGVYYYEVVADGAAEPAIATSGAGTACTTAEATITDPTGLSAGAKDIYIKVKDAAGNVSNSLKMDIPAYSAPDTTAPSLTAGAASRSSDTTGTVKFTSDEAGSYYYEVVADGATEPAIDTSGAGTACTTAETTINDPTGLTAGAKDIYIIVKDGAGNESSALKIDIAAYVAPSSGTGGGTSSGMRATQPTTKTVIIIVNGIEQDAGKEIVTTEDGKTTVTIEVNNEVMISKIDEAVKNNSTGNENAIQIPAVDIKSDVVKVRLTGEIVKKLEKNSFDVSVKCDNVEYIIPAAEFAISRVAENLGVLEKDLEDIKIEVRITKLDDAVVSKYAEAAEANGAELVFPPVEFEIVAKTTNMDGTVSDISISKFNNYVERILEIPAGGNPSKITTGIVFGPDGTYSHVPTEVFQKDGKWYTKLNSLTNSIYSVLWNPVTVNSVENHWSKDAVNDMAARLVVFNAESFDPNKAITRADFTEYIVRALGLYRAGSAHVNKFNDVSASGDRTLAILIAKEYGIVTGYPDGTFRPDLKITREEAMVMNQRAIMVTKLVGVDQNRYQNYADYNQVGSWATTHVKDVLSTGIFNGLTVATISPKANLTYAEAAQVIKNLLVESKLINQ